MNLAQLHDHIRRLFYTLYTVIAITITFSISIVGGLYMYQHRSTIVVSDFPKQIANTDPLFQYFYKTNLEKSLSNLNSSIKLPFVVSIIHRPCSEINMLYDSASKQITVCDEFLQKIIQQTPTSMDNAHFSEIYSQALFFIYHEIAHSIIDTGNVPVVENEESVADSIALWLLQNTQPSRFEIHSVVFSPLFTLVETSDDYEHIPNEQRLLTLACNVYGHNPITMNDIAEKLLDPKQATLCIEKSKLQQMSVQQSLQALFRTSS